VFGLEIAVLLQRRSSEILHAPQFQILELEANIKSAYSINFNPKLEIAKKRKHCIQEHKNT
jgi:hypothetical protein